MNFVQLSDLAVACAYSSSLQTSPLAIGHNEVIFQWLNPSTSANWAKSGLLNWHPLSDFNTLDVPSPPTVARSGIIIFSGISTCSHFFIWLIRTGTLEMSYGSQLFWCGYLQSQTRLYFGFEDIVRIR